MINRNSIWGGYRFHLHQHPYVQNLMQRLLHRGVSGLQGMDTEYEDGATFPGGGYRPKLYDDRFFGAYQPTDLVKNSPVKEIDFSPAGSYSAYNWELFYHVPLTIAIHLSKNQRFAEALRWFHYLFDPTDDTPNMGEPERFWKVKPFHEVRIRRLEELLENLATGDDESLRRDTVAAIGKWQDNPFRPHVVARLRHQAHMYKIVMAYLDNLIDWGDSLFRQDTGEAIDEALQLYVMAANLLGPRPQPVPKKGSVRPQTYANLRRDLREFGTAMVSMEEWAGQGESLPVGSGSDEKLAALRSLGQTLYFCVPRNDKLLGYWDTVADRLFKIRNSLNFHGIFRQLALFEPPIDPALLARAAAAGVDVGAVVNGVNQPLPLVRFAILVQKAAEIVQEVKSLGNSLLSAMEKEDGEAMALLRAKQERVILEMVERVRYGQLQEAIKSKEGLAQTLALAVQRYTYYERQLGKKVDEVDKVIGDAKQALGELDKDALARMKLKMEEPMVGLRNVKVDIAEDLDGSRGHIVSSYEKQELDGLAWAQFWQDSAIGMDALAAILGGIPAIDTAISPWGVGMMLQIVPDKTAHTLASGLRGIAARVSHEAGMNAKIGGYVRREQDWAFQSNLAAGEITQIFKQLRAAQIREAIAELELKNHRQQMKHAEEIEQFLNGDSANPKGKKTNQALYAWMKREVKGLYAQCFQFAFDVAKKAERALQHELGNPDLGYLQFGYLAGKEGLLAGEKLYLDIKRMEMAYHDQNRREYELTKHVSLLQVDPLALVQLRETGRCTVRLPESLFDMDGPGHYFRRIKTVAVSIPCVTGPYVSVNCTLTLLKSSIRKTPVVGEGYARADAEDDRFSDNFGSLQSIVTSSAQNDGGLFETNLRDERYLPFENSGVISEWQLLLPADPSKRDPAQFDYSTISDVILHIRYTAREGGSLLRQGAIRNLKTLIDEAKAAGSVRLFSVRDEFPTEWAKFQGQIPGANQRFALELGLREEHYPFWSKGRLTSVARVDVVARSSKVVTPATIDVFDRAGKADETKDSLAKDAGFGNLLVGKLTNITLPSAPEGSVRLYFDDKALVNVWIAVTWSSA